MKVSVQELQRDAILAVHSQGLRRFAQLAGQYVSRLSLNDRRGEVPSTSLESLRSISLSELSVDVVHRGRVLYGTFIVDAFMISSIATVLQDELNPALAVRVAIYNAVSPNASLAIVQNAYPKNARVAIKEPYLKRAADGGLAIRVDIPANVEILDGDACQRSGGKSSFDDPISLKEKGNAFFGEQKWTRAIDCYGRCIRSIVGQGSENENGKLLVIAYSNRAEAFIRLESYFEALTDCEAALSIDSHHTKSEYRKGRALQGLKRFEEAILCFESLLSRHPESREVQDVLDSMKRSCPDQA